MLSPPRKTTKRKKKPPTYYQPSIYSFTCRGAYSVSSSLMPPSAFSRSSSSSRINPNYNHDHAQQQPQQQQQAIIHERLRQQEGTCRGLRSQLELVTDELDVMTREWALQDFEHWVTQTTGSGSEDILGSLEEDAAAAAASAGADQNPTTAAANKSVLVPPMLVHKAPAPILHPAPPPEENKEDDNQSQNRLPTEPVVEIQPNSLHEEDHNHLIQQEDWSCYGSTQVDYLLLKDTQTGEETIAAVAPNNTTGLSVRSLQVGPDMRSSLIQLGWLTLVMQSTTEDYYDENAAAQQQQQDQHRNGTTSQHNNNNSNDSPSNMIPGQEVPGPPTTDAIQAAKESAQHVAAFSKKVAQHMKANATWLYGTLQDDFASRTAASGKRILHQVPKTAEQTASVLSTLAGRLADQWLGSGSGHDDDDDEDDDDRFNGRGGGGGRRQ